MQTPVLSIRNLRTYFHLDEGVLKAVDGLNLDLLPSQTIGIIGESGCGKSVAARSVLRLVYPPGRIEQGSQILLDTGGGDVLDIAGLSPGSADLRRVRGRHVAMIFQEPMTSLSPVHTVGFQIAEAILLHVTHNAREARTIAVESLARVGIPNPDRTFDMYPFELSGGLRQRVMIAMALSCKPTVLIADEPTTALDVTIQWQILRLMAELRREFAMSVLYITHDFGVLAQIADRVAVMYLGRIVESGEVSAIFKHPLHPYTQGLLKSIPRLGTRSRGRLDAITGTVPVPINLPVRCQFADRCQFVMPKCLESEPALVDVEANHGVRCYLHHQQIELHEAGHQETEHAR
jgi:peptide/nickel transport system ATP-binding protein